MGAVLFYLDKSTKARGVQVSPWKNMIQAGRWGRYGAWTIFNVNPDDDSVVVTDTSLYAGDGYYWSHRIRFS